MRQPVSSWLRRKRLLLRNNLQIDRIWHTLVPIHPPSMQASATTTLPPAPTPGLSFTTSRTECPAGAVNNINGSQFNSSYHIYNFYGTPGPTQTCTSLLLILPLTVLSPRLSASSSGLRDSAVVGKGEEGNMLDDQHTRMVGSQYVCR